ncbi:MULTISPECIES: IS1595 family transposase [unclassified Bradyrhizobium]|uniref:IS1595 family transposase n=1 Tax=unclassified Bradyrhizobium TaxID=2631580 RepID=UPI00247B0A3A|nr:MULTISPECIES: IS1595 family transposase [unclassified Bradyrhizobium]WGS20815.1 IS1595 family transposase [Bradyrhizobium sp. ISRA463]WGS27712.1 IS1595 family transposase [Bradyrhizobium sp. ISRA464]
MSVLAKAYFHNEKSAFRHLEKLLWADGVVCPHCGVVGKAGRLEGVKGKNGKNGKVRLGLWKCYEAGCRKQFTVRVGTVFESAHIPLHKCLQAVHLMASSKKGISAHQLHRILEIQYKSAWFLAHRIREAMRDGKLAPMGGNGKIVEVDETYIGRLKGMPKPKKGGAAHKNIVLTLVERGGSARSFHIDSTSIADIAPILRTNIRRESKLMTDEARHYMEVGREYDSHQAVNHGQEEYVRYGSDVITTNTVEGYYSIFKRGMKGVYQHCAEKHLHRYLAEFDFRYSNRVALGVDDQDRAEKAILGATGKRLTYRQPCSLDSETV